MFGAPEMLAKINEPFPLLLKAMFKPVTFPCSKNKERLHVSSFSPKPVMIKVLLTVPVCAITFSIPIKLRNTTAIVFFAML